MSDEISTIEAIYHGWKNYQGLLVAAIVPLTTEQLMLRSAPHLRSIEEIATHMVGARSRWFSPPVGDGDEEMAAYRHWDRYGEPERSAVEIIQGLGYTFDYIHGQIMLWTPETWRITIPGDGSNEPGYIHRQWIIWHLIEHDLHHGGEISLILGMHHLKAPEL